MKRKLDQELALEVGFVLFAAGISTGLAALFFGKARGTVRYRQRHSALPPSPGTVPEERQRNISAVAAR